jgi:hypothetical protein
MITCSWLVAGLLTLTSAGVFAQDYRMPASSQSAPGSPGTSTPQPFIQPTPRSVPQSTPNAAPLLNRSTGNNGSLLIRPSGNLAPLDGDVPLLDEQRQRNSQGLGRDSRQAN